ncbi:MAG: 3-phosphoglycerate dehydrogenase family protein [Gammaproteobacteria bacterium]
MFKILTYNNISVSGLDRFPHDKYEVASEIQHPDAILLRSFQLHGVNVAATVKAVGRAGAGVNNIPVKELTRRGIPVFNSPGANANAVAELVVAGMLLAYRRICDAWYFAKQLGGEDAEIDRNVESGKKQFVGRELPGKTLGIIGLGAIGVRVANAAHALGMNVIGCDPMISLDNAWKLSSSVMQASGLEDLLVRSDFVSVHVPYNQSTHHTINQDRIRLMKDGAVALNFSRGGVMDDEAICNALDRGKLSAYVCDFPNGRLLAHPKVIALPHLGASTEEAENNCAMMVVDQLKDFLENGNIRNAVNFPDISLPRIEGCRIVIANENIPHMVSQISTYLADAELNILDLINKSQGEVAFTIIDVESEVPEKTVEQIQSISGVLSARLV